MDAECLVHSGLFRGSHTRYVAKVHAGRLEHPGRHGTRGSLLHLGRDVAAALDLVSFLPAHDPLSILNPKGDRAFRHDRHDFRCRGLCRLATHHGRVLMDRENRTNVLTVLGFAGGVIALGLLITVMLVFG